MAPIPLGVTSVFPSDPGPLVPGLEQLHRRDTRLDSYVDRYAAQARGMTASAIRALFAVANRPEVVSLAGGMPNITDLPLDVIGSIIGDLVIENGRQAMQYGSGQGEQPMREAICEVMKLEGISAHPDDVTVTVGSQQGLDLVTRLFCDPGDVVICEAPSYVGALGVFRLSSAKSYTSRWMTTGCGPTRSARRSRHCMPPASGSSSSTRSPISTILPASPRPSSAGPPSWRSPSEPT